MRRLAIVQRVVTDYRVAFYTRLHSRLAEEGFDLVLFSSPMSSGDGFREGLTALPFARTVPKVDLIGRAYWQPLWRTLRGYDLVIVEQANSALLNYALFLSRLLLGRPRRIAFWGHGTTLQGGGGMRGRLKSVMIGVANHWFAYTAMTAQILRRKRYPSDRITIVNNSIDVSLVSEASAEKRRVGRVEYRRPLGLGEEPVAVFCSRLYAGKKLDFLLAVADRVRVAVPNFTLLLIGDGPERASMESFSLAKPWVRVLGPLYGVEKAQWLAASDLMLMPAWVGLSILDGFAAGLPVVVADFDNHSPEIVYLRDGINGVLTAATEDAYGDAVIAVLTDSARLAQLSDGAFQAAAMYSLDEMVNNFANGVLAALAD